MLTVQRHQLILSRLARDGQLLAKPFAEELETSEDTIRRDLRALAQAGKLQRVHGGALPASEANATLAVRQAVAPDDKAALGRAGARMVKPGQLVILDGGTTALQVARHLPDELRATVVTHSPVVAVELVRKPRLEVVMLGGRLFRHSMVNVGTTVIEAAARYRADIYFMGVTGVHPTQGLSTGDDEEAAVKRALSARAAETVVLASHEKLMAASSFVVAPMGAVDLLVVPQHTEAKVVRQFRSAGVTVLIAPDA
jgi:DeoR/GlpR family transcriptional regulator of sugar metabolism